eukprot:ANDGO_08426.mRNA.1 hypothetical protein
MKMSEVESHSAENVHSETPFYPTLRDQPVPWRTLWSLPPTFCTPYHPTQSPSAAALDLDTLQAILPALLSANVDLELGIDEPTKMFLKSLQLSVDYLLYVQNFLEMKVSETKASLKKERAKIAQLNIGLMSNHNNHNNNDNDRSNGVDENSAREGKGSAEKGALGMCSAVPCPYCAKYFQSIEFLEAHVGRRHPEQAHLLDRWVRFSYSLMIDKKRQSAEDESKKEEKGSVVAAAMMLQQAHVETLQAQLRDLASKVENAASAQLAMMMNNNNSTSGNGSGNALHHQRTAERESVDWKAVVGQLSNLENAVTQLKTKSLEDAKQQQPQTQPQPSTDQILIPLLNRLEAIEGLLVKPSVRLGDLEDDGDSNRNHDKDKDFEKERQALLSAHTRAVEDMLREHEHAMQRAVDGVRQEMSERESAWSRQMEALRQLASERVVVQAAAPSSQQQPVLVPMEEQKPQGMRYASPLHGSPLKSFYRHAYTDVEKEMENVERLMKQEESPVRRARKALPPREFVDQTETWVDNMIYGDHHGSHPGSTVHLSAKDTKVIAGDAVKPAPTTTSKKREHAAEVVPETPQEMRAGFVSKQEPASVNTRNNDSANSVVAQPTAKTGKTSNSKDSANSTFVPVTGGVATPFAVARNTAPSPAKPTEPSPAAMSGSNQNMSNVRTSQSSNTPVNSGSATSVNTSTVSELEKADQSGLQSVVVDEIEELGADSDEDLEHEVVVLRPSGSRSNLSADAGNASNVSKNNDGDAGLVFTRSNSANNLSSSGSRRASPVASSAPAPADAPASSNNNNNNNNNNNSSSSSNNNNNNNSTSLSSSRPSSRNATPTKPVPVAAASSGSEETLVEAWEESVQSMHPDESTDASIILPVTTRTSSNNNNNSHHNNNHSNNGHISNDYDGQNGVKLTDSVTASQVSQAASSVEASSVSQLSSVSASSASTVTGTSAVPSWMRNHDGPRDSFDLSDDDDIDSIHI